MSFSSSINSLSALTPVRFGYNYNSDETLICSTNVFSNQLVYYKHGAFENLQDTAISKKNVLFLTDTMPLSNVFSQTINTSTIGGIAGTITLQTLSGDVVQYTGDTLYVGPLTHDTLILTLTPVDTNVVEINTNNGSYLVFDETYPYTIRTSTAPLATNQQYRKRFKLDYSTSNGTLTLAVDTNAGSRYVSYDANGIMRANGLQLNNLIINSILFVPFFVTSFQLSLGFDPKSSEVKYYNDIESFAHRTTVDVQAVYTSDTNLLISCAAKDIVDAATPNINIAMLKTNYTSTGTYAPTVTLSGG